VLTNEIPEFEDESGALPNRFIVLEMRESFLGREDPDLTDKLLAERPGILNWALAGWDSLRARRRFEQPASGREAAEALAIAASDIKAFVDDKCELGSDFEVEVSKLHGAWKLWREANALRSNLAPNQFSAKLKAAYPEIGIERPRSEDPKRPRLFVGIRVKKKSVKPQTSTSVVVPLAPRTDSGHIAYPA
jgi:putative DNA primase/helicase